MAKLRSTTVLKLSIVLQACATSGSLPVFDDEDITICLRLYLSCRIFTFMFHVCHIFLDIIYTSRLLPFFYLGRGRKQRKTAHREIRPEENQQICQSDLVALNNWATKWRCVLSFNLFKCNISAYPQRQFSIIQSV